MDDQWAAHLLNRIVDACGQGSPDLWVVRATTGQAPALVRAMSSTAVRVGDLLRDPMDRTQSLSAVALMQVRADHAWLSPADDDPVQLADALLFAGTAPAQSDQQSILFNDEATGYLLTGRDLPASWLLRALQRTPGP
jgi:hypothetical protein